MSTSKHVDRFCLAAVAVTLVLTILFMCGGSPGLNAAKKAMKYESTLFDSSRVHKLDIVMEDWDAFLETCENEEYAACTVVVDGQKHKNVAIRAKGNTSLSSVRSMGSRRYSFKLEFDHYQKGKTLDGLDKLCLNNLIQDNTMMKDYLVYQMMADFGADSPLCSFVWITVNGADWGLYLAVEGVEDSFLARTYGSDAGELYKPDSMSFGGGRGNGRDFRMNDLDPEGRENQDVSLPQGGQFPGQPGDGQQGGFPQGGQFPGQPGVGGQDGQFPGQHSEGRQGEGPEGSMGSDDVKLKYIDDDPDSYANIFDNAKTDISASDRKRLIASLKQLSAYTSLEDVLDTEEVLRYFVVHNFVCNGDSYTGSMIHNYYLHEADGKLAMIPWDYNLAFGTFQSANASASVNASIDNPVSGSLDDRPMVGWIFSDAGYTEQYHVLFKEFLDRWFSDGQLEKLIVETEALIRPYVEQDPTKFCTAEEFSKGTAALKQFVSLRSEAVRRQLAGDSTAVDTSGLTLSDMGTMGGGGVPGGGERSGGEQPGGFPSAGRPGNGGSGEAPTAPTQSGEGSMNPGEAPQNPGEAPQNPGEAPQNPGGRQQRPDGSSGRGAEGQGQPPNDIGTTGSTRDGGSESSCCQSLHSPQRL